MSELGKIIDPKTIRLERSMPGPVERVRDFLTKPEFRATWLASGEIELRVGGRVDLQMTEGPGVHGVVTRCDPPRALAYTWIVDGSEAMRPAGEDLESVLGFELKARGDQVVLVLTHRPIWDGFMARTASGWHTLLDRLAAAMRGEEPEPFMDIFSRILPEYERLVASTGSRKQSG